MQIRHELFIIAMRRNQRRIHIARMAGGEAQALKPLNLAELRQQAVQPHAVMRPRIDVLPQ